MTDTTDIHRAICKYCLTEEGMATFEITIKEQNEFGTYQNAHTLEITQCMKCKMIQPQEE